MDRAEVSTAPRIFLFSGEGAHSSETDTAFLKLSKSWSVVEDALHKLGFPDTETFLLQNLGKHHAPTSPVVSVVLNILNADLWQQWGEVPSIVLGHSVGEIAAAYVAGIFTVDEAISCAHSLGLAMLDMPGSKGVMLHTELQRKFLHTMEDVHLAAVNFVIQKGPTEQEDLLSVTLCSLGSAEAYLAQDPKATLLKPQHAWHHPACKLPASPVQPLPRGQHSSGPLFISAVTATQLDELPEDHWQRWCCCPVNFAAALEVANNLLRGASPVVLEMGPHPVLFQAAKASFDLAGYACSMRRGEKQGPLLRSQRALVPGFGLKLRNVLSSQLKTWKLAKPLADDLEITFADQGLASQHLVPLTQELRNFFPTLAVHDLYRFNSVEELIQRWDAGVTASHTWTAHASSGLDILGCGVRLPAGVNSPGAFWALLEEDDQSSAFSSKAGFKAAFLEPKFDHKAALVAAEESGLEGAEAAALDPQHALALQLAKEMFHDADPAAVKLLQTRPERVGVYIGAWQEVSISTKTSAFHAIGASLSALAARVANTYDLQGPAVTINTACSSALVAVHEAMKDAKTGRIDFAIVGGVNLFGEDLQLFHHLRRAAMLSPSGKCHTFSAEADGYVRAEGGVLFLLAREDLELPSHGCILGSAVTQNSRRKPLSSVDPTAQERAICLACEDAGLQSSELAAVELHGTGTPLGDPVEVSALARAIRDGAGCKMTAAKMHVGHLESAAGAVGLLKVMLMCQHHKVPAFQIDGNSLNQQVMAALEGSCLCQPGDEGLLMDNAKVGISSFGFAGSNAHVVMMAAKKCPAEKYAVPVPVQKTTEPPVKQLEMLSSTMSPRCSASSETYYADTIPKQKDGADVEDVDIVTCLSFVSSAVLSIVGGGVEVDVDADLHELGLDSLGLAELLGLLEDKYGAGCISVEKIMEEPACRAIAAMLEGCEIVAKSLPPPVLPVVKVAPLIHAKTSPATEHVAQSDANVDHVDGFHSVDHHGWIRTTHVGSLPRPADGTLDLNQVIAQQADCVDIINDGEWGRENYIADVINRVSGLQSGDKTEPQTACCAKHAMPLASDMQDVPIYAQRFSGGNGLITLNPKRPAVSGLACVDHPKYTPGNMASLQAFLTAVSAAGKPVSDCFYSVPSPGTMALFCRDFVFNDHAAYVMALADALAEEYQQIAQHGLQLQVDCPDLAMGRHTKWSDLSEKDFLDVARCNVAALNQALQHVPVEQVRVHVCWGNYAGPHHQDMSAELLWPLLGEVKAKYLLMEGANPRHRADVQCFEEAVKKGYFKSHQVIVPGLIDTTTARVEDPRLIAESLLRYARAAGHPARVIASTDCGFASTARSTAITADLAWMKLQSLKAGAQLATRSFLEQQAPVLCRSIALTSTPFRPVIFSSQEPSVVSFASKLCKALDRAAGASVHPALHFTEPEAACEALRWMVDVPSAFVVLGESMALAEAARTQLEAVGTVSRRPATLCCFSVFEEIAHVVEEVRRTALSQTSFDKRCLVLPRSKVPPVVDVVVVGAGLLGMLTAHRCTSAGFSVAVLEQRPVIGGIWSMYANSTSQVNSSEGGYCIKDILGEDGETEFDNRDHSTAAEILKDLAKLGDCLQQHIFTSVKVMKILGEGGNYTVLFQDELALRAGILQCRGVVLCVNDRVGLPRPLNVPGQDSFLGVVADGTSDSLAGTDWRGKRVVIAGMGAFAVENVRTALEHGASEVTVVARRHGTICPKAIDYLNFVKPWDEKYKHDTQTNVKQFLRWKQLYEASGCQVPECWPKQVKHDGHTISVSDIWFIAHHMKKLSTKTGVLQKIEREGVVLSTGDFVPCDVVVGCIGFERSNTLCETLTGRSEVKTTNYLDQDMMYLADAEIDEGAFNSFFGSSVLEYGKFFSNVFVEGLQRPDVLGEQLWGSLTTSVPISQRKWNQYIASAMKLIEVDHQISEHARHQVEARTKHFWRTLPPSSFLAVNRREWEEMHDRLNGGVPVPKEQQLPYFFEEIPAWC